MPSKGEGLYQQHYETATANGASQGTDLLTLQLESEGQISSIEIWGGDVQDFHIEVRDYDVDSGTTVPGSADTVYNMAGNQNYSSGDFEDPVVEVGAIKEIAVVNDTALSADEYAVNIRVDELTG